MRLSLSAQPAPSKSAPVETEAVKPAPPAAPVISDRVSSLVLIHPYPKDVVIKGNRGLVRYFFELPRGTSVAQDAAFELSFQSSALASQANTYISVLLNDQPIETKIPKIGPREIVAWPVVVPKGMFKEGFNDLSISVGSKSTSGPCQDDNDQGEWLRLKAKSFLNFNLLTSGGNDLSAYPFPFINSITQPPTLLPIVVSPAATERTLAAGLNLAANWGQRLVDKPFMVSMLRGTTDQPAVRVGLTKDLRPAKLSAPIVASQGSLFVSGENPDALDSAIETLSTPEVTDQFQGPSAGLMQFKRQEEFARIRLGDVSFTELGVPALDLRGIGLQSTSIQLHRPLSAALGRDTRLTLRFRHAATLSKHRSMLTVTINDKPLSSVVLSPENANNGELVCPVPVEMVSRNEWNIGISAYNDLASVDCAKRYESIAWTQILGESEITLSEGTLGYYPYLDGFPYLRSAQGRLPAKATIGLRKDASNEELTLAAAIVGRASQSNRGAPGWEVSHEVLSGNESVIVGLFTEEGRFSAIANSLPIRPRGIGGPVVSKELPFLPTTLAGGVVIEAVKSPSGGTSYVVLGASRDALGAFATFLGSPRGANALKDQVAVFTREGKLYTYSTLSAFAKKQAETAELHRYKAPMMMIMSGVITLIIGFGVFIGSKFVKRKSPTA